MQRYHDLDSREQKIKKPMTITSDPAKEQTLEQIKTRRAELVAALGENRAELAELITGLGRRVVEGGDPGELGAELARRRAIEEGLQAGVNYLDNQAALLLRALPWIRR